ncbi:MAG: NADH:flavin oxidoreductase [Frankiales bacterium]|nr:NADH:flavin oxidoreductase [Frankiales bacterium]
MITPVLTPAQLGPVMLRNRVIKAATFEGMSPQGRITDALIDFHRSYAAGGVGMTTVAYCAVSMEGRGAPSEIVLRRESLPGLTKLAETVHAEGAAVSAQIGHAGPVGNKRVTKAKALAASSGWSPLGTRFSAATKDDIARITADFASGARLLVDAGFDAVELHMGHHYLINSFMSPRWNRRKDAWGGSVEARAQFPREVAQAVREAVGTSIAVTAKFEMTDAVPGGLWLDQSIPIAQLLESDGTLDAMQLTAGGSLANPMFLFRGDVPREEFSKTLPVYLRPAFKLVGKRFMPAYPFEESYFRPLARQFRSALSMPLIALGGINELASMEQALDDGFAFVALGRALLREPDLVSTLATGDRTSSLCIHCNKCMPSIYTGTHCVLVDAEKRPGVRLMPESSG